MGVSLRAPFRIVAFGSSSTEGSGASSAAKTYPAQLADLFRRDDPRLSVEVLNRGAGGEDILDMMKRLQANVLAAQPDLVIWQIGSNDPLRGISLARFREHADAGISAMLGAGCEVLLMEPQWCPALSESDPSNLFTQAVRQIGAERGLRVLRRHDLMQQWIAEGLATADALIGPDALHMTDRGYALLAQAVYDEIVAHSARFCSFEGVRPLDGEPMVLP